MCARVENLLTVFNVHRNYSVKKVHQIVFVMSVDEFFFFLMFWYCLVCCENTHFNC